MAAPKGKPLACDGVVCCIGCMSFIPGFIKRVVNQVAFFPPRPAGYYISDNKQTYLVTEFERCSLEPLPDLSAEGVQVDTIELQTRRGNWIYAFHFRRLDSSKTLLFSHGNSTDIGIMFAHLLELCQRLRVDILAYEYSGYGQSTGLPSEKNLYADIDAAYEYLTLECDVPANRIVCYGQSVGSAPSLDLAARCPIGGLVLHSALKSGLSVVHEVKTTHWFDVFQNVVKVKSVQCPVFILHGTADTEVPFEHGVALYDACPTELAYDPWWVQEGGHNDIEVVWRSMYFLRLQNFISAVDRWGSGAYGGAAYGGVGSDVGVGHPIEPKVGQEVMHHWSPYWSVPQTAENDAGHIGQAPSVGQATHQPPGSHSPLLYHRA